MARLCAAYWYPVYCFIRYRSCSHEDAADLTQDYFARLMEGRLLSAADPDRGRFRTLLRHDLGLFLADQADRRRAIKRGGGVVHVPLLGEGEARYRSEPIDGCDAGRLFDRAWAQEVLRQTRAELANQERAAGRGEVFAILEPALASRAIPVAELGAKLGVSTSAAEGALRRLRKRYARTLRTVIAGTQRHPTDADIDEEIIELFEALRQPNSAPDRA